MQAARARSLGLVVETRVELWLGLQLGLWHNIGLWFGHWHVDHTDLSGRRVCRLRRIVAVGGRLAFAPTAPKRVEEIGCLIGFGVQGLRARSET